MQPGEKMPHQVQTDLRIRRTHKFLQEAMIELIAEKGFEAITVGDIAERAMINRATFYRHYQDKYDLVANIFEETASQLVEDMLPYCKDASQGMMDNPPAIWVQLFEHVSEHHRLYHAMLGKNGSSWFAARMSEYIVRIMMEQEREWERQALPTQPVDPAMPHELPAMQLAYVLIGTIIWWLDGERHYTPRQMASWFHHFAFFGYLSALGYEKQWS
jgi:AcrR family transcriptional regulator